jgi:hypothetical protein
MFKHSGITSWLFMWPVPGLYIISIILYYSMVMLYIIPWLSMFFSMPPHGPMHYPTIDQTGWLIFAPLIQHNGLAPLLLMH